MPLVCYVDRNFSAGSLHLIDQANTILDEYAKQGFDLTLRQLYYQFVSRGLLANKPREYKRLGSVINDARLAGYIDWDRIVDRTRELKREAHWENPGDILDACARQFRIDKWEGQEVRPEVWIEKDALVGVIEGICKKLQVPYFSCRGYTSQSEMWTAAQRLIEYAEQDQRPYIVHLGDHDPSGIDMSRDIQDRLDLFMEHHGFLPPSFKRLALNMDQITKYKPPPNPAKVTDSRSTGYIKKHGQKSWELDALEPTVMSSLISTAVLEVRDESLWKQALQKEKAGKEALRFAAQNWERIQFISEDGDWSDDAFEDFVAESEEEDEEDGDSEDV